MFNDLNIEINYIHKESNHPPSIIKQIPFSVESRLSSISSNEKIFNESTPIYQKAIKKSGYDYKLKYLKKYLNNKLKTTTEKEHNLV